MTPPDAGWPFLPSPEQKRLLEACLWDAEDALASWRNWRDLVVFDDLDVASFRLIPLLRWNLHRIGVPPSELTRYTGIARYFWAKQQLAVAKATETIRLFEQAGIKTMLVKGAAIGPLYYSHPGSRPMEDFDLVVSPEHVPQAVEIAQNAGWRLEAHNVHWRPLLARTHAMTLLHASGQQLDLHWHILHDRRRPEIDAAFRAGSRLCSIGGRTVTTLSDTDHLIHACVHGARRNPVAPVRWIADATFILRRGTVDWPRLLHNSRAWRQILPVRIALTYLAEAMGCPVPAQVVASLRRAPVSRGERFDFRLANELSDRGRLHLLRRRYREYVNGQSGATGPLGFLRYQQAIWGKEDLASTMGELMRRVRQQPSAGASR